MAQIAVAYTAKDSISVYVSGLDTSYSYSDRTVSWSCNGQNKSASLGAKVSSGGSVTFSGLSPSTAYTVSCTIYYRGGSAGLSATVTTDNVIRSVYVHNNDEGIARIVYGNGSGDITVNQGDGSMTAYAVYGSSGNRTPTIFTAYPASGYEFDCWRYTLAGSSTIHITSQNPFVYTGEANITISAVSKPISTPEPTGGTVLIGGQEYEMLIYDGSGWGGYEPC